MISSCSMSDPDATTCTVVVPEGRSLTAVLCIPGWVQHRLSVMAYVGEYTGGVRVIVSRLWPRGRPGSRPTIVGRPSMTGTSLRGVHAAVGTGTQCRSSLLRRARACRRYRVTCRAQWSGCLSVTGLPSRHSGQVNPQTD